MPVLIDKSDGRISVISTKGLFIREGAVWREGVIDPDDLKDNFSIVQDAGEADKLLNEALMFVSNITKVKNISRLRQKARRNMLLFMLKEGNGSKVTRTKEELQAMEERFYRQVVSYYLDKLTTPYLVELGFKKGLKRFYL